ncbi:OsmC family protein [Promicromonospora thailandica]|uniref:OsmC-like protein n=1 Tax=Promicromonospora thailandica TaxID=765201 RepID=A0A9X2JW14_9MICO|nr:OsmC family protein [Promicromonospora thailandica]MCP2265666.1 OsmC-like protein [Promicromonospora thailandica]
MDPLSSFGVTAGAGSLRPADGVALPHTWTADGIVAHPASNGAQMLHLAVAVCVLNDTFREARELGIDVTGVAVTADGTFDDAWRSTGIVYTLTVDSPAPADDVERLVARVDDVAEIPRALRAGTDVRRSTRR